TLAVSADRAAAFRLARHHLTDQARRSAGGAEAGLAEARVRTMRAEADDLQAVCSDVCGIQAQIMSAAELALWTRWRGATRSGIKTALWDDRTLVKTSLMRMTLHLVAAAEYTLYIAALKENRMAFVRHLLARLRIAPDEMNAINTIVVDALEAGPLTQQALVTQARPHASRRMRRWFDRVWIPFR